MVKNPPAMEETQEVWVWSVGWEDPWRRKHQPTPVLLPGKSHGRRSLVGYILWGRKESGTTERLHFHFSLSCIGEENGNPLQCSCLETPRDRGAWWAAVSGVTQSRTRLKRLGSSKSLSFISALIFMISLLLLTLGFVCSYFSSCFRCNIRLFI